MEESPLIDQIPQEVKTQITDTIKVNYVIDNNRTWNRTKLLGCLPNYVVDKIMNILIHLNDFQDKIC